MRPMLWAYKKENRRKQSKKRPQLASNRGRWVLSRGGRAGNVEAGEQADGLRRLIRAILALDHALKPQGMNHTR